MPDEELECPICLSVPADPALTSCNHLFCRKCLIRSIRSNGWKCPMCRNQNLQFSCTARFSRGATADRFNCSFRSTNLSRHPAFNFGGTAPAPEPPPMVADSTPRVPRGAAGGSFTIGSWITDSPQPPAFNFSTPSAVPQRQEPPPFWYGNTPPPDPPLVATSDAANPMLQQNLMMQQLSAQLAATSGAANPMLQQNLLMQQFLAQQQENLAMDPAAAFHFGGYGPPQPEPPTFNYSAPPTAPPRQEPPAFNRNTTPAPAAAFRGYRGPVPAPTSAFGLGDAAPVPAATFGGLGRNDSLFGSAAPAPATAFAFGGAAAPSISGFRITHVSHPLLTFGATDELAEHLLLRLDIHRFNDPQYQRRFDDLREFLWSLTRN